MDAPELTGAPMRAVDHHPIPTPARLLSAPLPELLDETGVILFDSSITDSDFFGTAVVRGDGRVLLSMPEGRDEAERDTVARALLGEVFDVELPALPDSFAMTELAVAA